jgi:colanic acid/amylovoran biosynthesis glycosyltransferase
MKMLMMSSKTFRKFSMPENNPARRTLRVLHSVGTFLNVSENWIYPQIACVPNVSGRVLCGAIINREMFPIGEARLFINPPPWKKAFGIPRICNALARRVGWGGSFVRAKIAWWEPQVLHAHFGMRGWESVALKIRLQCRLITSFYGYDAWLLPKAEPVWRARYHELFGAGDVFLVEGPAMRDRLCELGCPEEKVVIQRIGVDLDSLVFEARDFSSELKIIMVARFVEKKGFADGLRACAIASAQGTKLSVTVVGDASIGDEAGQRIKRELLEIAKCPELAGHVRFTGFVPLLTIQALLKEHNVFLCPSKHAANGDAEGGSPVALTEAMAAGLLCVGTRHCDIPQVILNGKTGFLCKEGDVSEIAETLSILQQNSGKSSPITENGRRHVEENFSLQAQMDKLGAIYRGE